MMKNMIVVFGDQLSLSLPVVVNAKPDRDVILLAEVSAEATYVKHNRHKMVLLFAAMRHFAATLRDKGLTVCYVSLEQQLDSFADAIAYCLDLPGHENITHIVVHRPGEYRVLEQIEQWREQFPCTLLVEEDPRFLCSVEDFSAWASGRKQLRMEYFYREMRKRYQLLLTQEGEPEGGKWNYDAENRVGWRGQEQIPPRPIVRKDPILLNVIEMVLRRFPDHPGDLVHFNLAVTPEEAAIQFEWFCDHALVHFGRYQDALVDDSPYVFHSLVSMYLNCGLLEPLELCRQVEARYRAGRCDLASAEGFIRQIIGWREYVRGIYWLTMPEYASRNSLQASRALPSWFWTGDTPLRCLSQAVRQSLDLGYAHHIQRLMVIGNFALLSGLDVSAVCDWYLAVYVDAYEWVELPNTLGMALHADGGMMASKPYAASGNYLNKQGDHCRQCRFDPKQMTGDSACPYNSLYWRFIDQHSDTFARNPRMSLILANWRKRDAAEQAAILQWADVALERFA
jgi:deoxyribodipyrimidine photolyase-related protein